MTVYEMMEWREDHSGAWTFGIKERGVIRKVYAFVGSMRKQDGARHWWADKKDGSALSHGETTEGPVAAIQLAEKALGL